MWDLRKIGKGVKALASASQNNTILSAYWAPRWCAHTGVFLTFIQHLMHVLPSILACNE